MKHLPDKVTTLLLTRIKLPKNIKNANAKNNSAQNRESSSIASRSEGMSGFFENTLIVNVKN